MLSPSRRPEEGLLEPAGGGGIVPGSGALSLAPRRCAILLRVMGTAAQQILAEALRLPLTERAAMAAELIASMDGDPDGDADEAWTAEIERRASRAIGGRSSGREWDAVLREIETKHRRQ